MKLAIADPPYYKRAERWYGPGGGGSGYGAGRADQHPEAGIWDEPEAHEALVRGLIQEYDGWVVAGTSDPRSLALYASIIPAGTRTMVWHRPRSVPSGARVSANWEPVYAYIPRDRLGHGKALEASDVLRASPPTLGFIGAKPPTWTRWVLTVLGYDPEVDDVTDLFPGSGAVTDAVSGMLW